MHFDKRLKQWSWYWHIKLKHRKRKLCSGFTVLNSFEMFSHPEHGGLFLNSELPIFEMPMYNLKMLLRDDHCSISFDGGSYKIPFEKQQCNYGGYRYFFRCPNQQCDKRMRLLYCHQGLFLCRKCLNLGYWTQLLCPPIRMLMRASKIEKLLKNKAGSLSQKPPWMKKRTFTAIKNRYAEYYGIKFEQALERESVEIYGEEA